MSQTSKSTIAAEIARDAEFGTLPVLNRERKFGFWDTLLILGGYGIATWCYTQGAFQATLVSFPQLVVTAFAANILLLSIYMLPIVFATRYGIDMWQWLKSIFGTRGIRILVVLIILVNFPWFGVNAEIFASTMVNLITALGFAPAPWASKPLALLCILAGVALALGGPAVIKWVNRFMVPSLILVGIGIVVLAFTSVPLEQLMSYEPDVSAYSNPLEPYVASIEASFAFGFSWCCSTAVFPRLVKKERQGYWATVGAYGVIAPFFVVAGGVLAIVTAITTGAFDSDLASMVRQLATPVISLVILLLIVVANIGTHGTGTYMWSVVIKSAFPNAKYVTIVFALAAYASLIVLWGGILDYFGAMISMAAYLYGPIMGLLFADYFVVRRRRLDLRSAYEIPGHSNYVYSKGYNWYGFASLAIGFVASVAVFDAISYRARSEIFNFTTSSFLGFLVGGIVYVLAYLFLPSSRSYMLKDRNDASV